MPPLNPKRKATPTPGPKLSPAQQKKRAALFRKLIEAIETGYASQALTKLAEMQKRFPTDVNVHGLTGRAHASLGRHAEAIEAFEKAVSLKPDDPEIRHQYASALHKGGEFEEALVEFERVLYLKPDHFFALRHKASTLTDLGREPEAYKAFQAPRGSVQGHAARPVTRAGGCDLGGSLRAQADRSPDRDRYDREEHRGLRGNLVQEGGLLSSSDASTTISRTTTSPSTRTRTAKKSI